MERLTFASLAHLPTAVLFVIDPTGLSGEKSTVAAQLNVRKALKERFPRRPWLDVVSKGDLIDQVHHLPAPLDTHTPITSRFPPPRCPRASGRSCRPATCRCRSSRGRTWRRCAGRSTACSSTSRPSYCSGRGRIKPMQRRWRQMLPMQ